MEEPVDYEIERIKSAKLAYLAFIANTGRKISSFERDYFVRKANLDALAATSPELTDEVKSKIDEFYDWALQQELLMQKPFESAPGHSTVMCTLTPRGYEHLKRYAYQQEQPQKMNSASQPISLNRAAKIALNEIKRGQKGVK